MTAAATVLPTGVSSATALGDETVAVGISVAVTGTASATALGDVTVLVPDVTVYAAGVASPCTLGYADAYLVHRYPPTTKALPAGAFTQLQTTYTSNTGIHSYGRPYFAAVQLGASGFGWFGGGEQTLSMAIAIHAAPVRFATDDEPHWLLSFHEINGDEVVALGVTPSLRVIARTLTRGLLYSDPGVVAADGVVRRWTLFLTPGQRALSIDTSLFVMDEFSSGAADGFYSPTNAPCRFMAFNGIRATTRCECSILAIALETENDNFVWPFQEGEWKRVAGYETHSGIGEPLDPVPQEFADVPGEDWTLTCDWYDPRPQYPLPCGAPPTEDASAGFSWLLQTQYHKGVVIGADYHDAGAIAADYHAGGEVNPVSAQPLATLFPGRSWRSTTGMAAAPRARTC